MCGGVGVPVKLNADLGNLKTCGIYLLVPEIVVNTVSEVPIKIPHELYSAALYETHVLQEPH